jgi:cytosine/adenosine deaminase-related metal-dependent hydrolase
MTGQPTPGRAAVYSASRLFIDAATVVSPGAVAVVDGVVVAAGAPGDVARSAPAGSVRFEFPGAAILPGLVNAHTHLQIPRLPDAAPGSAAPATFVDWILRIVAWKRAAMPEEFARNLASAAAESLASGTTAVGEIAGPDAAAYAACPLRARIFAEGIGFTPEAAPAAMDAVRAAVGTIEAVAARNPLVAPGVSPHSPYTVGPVLLRMIAELASRRSLPAALHLAESPAEMEFLRTGDGEIATRLYPAVGKDVSFFGGIGTSIPDYLSAAGLLRPGLVLVHNVHLSREDVSALRAGGARFVLCPRSNAVHGNGAPDVTHFVDAEIPFALGTDSAASVPDASLWDEMRAARAIYRGVLPETELCRALFRAATENGAGALSLCPSGTALRGTPGSDLHPGAGLGGTLRPGATADFVLVEDAGGEGAAAYRDLVERTGTGRVLLTAVGGRRVHERT